MFKERFESCEQEREALSCIHGLFDAFVICAEAGVRDARKNILAGYEVFGVSNQGVLQMAEAYRSGTRFPTLILVGKNRESPLVVLEGHMRLTAMFLAPQCLPTELEVMVGFSEQIERWGCY